MKKAILIGLIMLFGNGTVRADWYGQSYYPGYRYSYDAVDAMADNEVAAISAQEQAQVIHELQEGDFREAQRIIQHDEAIKYRIRQNEALYDQARDMNRYGYSYGYYGDND